MLTLTRNDRPNYELFTVAINAITENMGIPIDMVRLKGYYDFYTEKLSDIREKINKHAQTKGVAWINPNSWQQLQDFLINKEYIPRDLLKKGNTNKLTTGSDQLRKVYEKIKTPFIPLIIEYKEINEVVKSLAEIYKYVRMPIEPMENDDGHELGLVFPTFERRATSRFYSATPNIQGLHSEVKGIISALKGYTLVSCDFKQQELIISLSTICRTPKLMKYLSSEKDKYTGFIKYLSDLDTIDEELRDKYKVGILASSYGSGLNTIRDSTQSWEIARQIYNFYQNNETLKNYKKGVYERMRKGDDTILSFFGTPRKLDRSVRSDILDREIINTPIQTTGADLSVFSLTAIVEESSSKNYSYAEDYWMVLPRHDEIVFMVKDEHLDVLSPLIHQNFHIQVEDWTPILSSKFEGKYYNA